LASTSGFIRAITTSGFSVSNSNAVRIAALDLHIRLLEQRRGAIARAAIGLQLGELGRRRGRLTRLRLVDRAQQQLGIFAARFLLPMAPIEIAAEGEQRRDHAADDPASEPLPDIVQPVLADGFVHFLHQGRIVRRAQRHAYPPCPDRATARPVVSLATTPEKAKLFTRPGATASLRLSGVELIFGGE
jgi:hypothetical protein